MSRYPVRYQCPAVELWHSKCRTTLNWIDKIGWHMAELPDPDQYLIQIWDPLKQVQFQMISKNARQSQFRPCQLCAFTAAHSADWVGSAMEKRSDRVTSVCFRASRHFAVSLTAVSGFISAEWAVLSWVVRWIAVCAQGDDDQANSSLKNRWTTTPCQF